MSMKTNIDGTPLEIDTSDGAPLAEVVQKATDWCARNDRVPIEILVDGADLLKVGQEEMVSLVNQPAENFKTLDFATESRLKIVEDAFPQALEIVDSLENDHALARKAAITGDDETVTEISKTLGEKWSLVTESVFSLLETIFYASPETRDAELEKIVPLFEKLKQDISSIGNAARIGDLVVVGDVFGYALPEAAAEFRKVISRLEETYQKQKKQPGGDRGNV